MAKIVAIAGGTGGWGKTVIEQSQKENGKFQLIVLTRGMSRQEGDIKYVHVDYDNIPALTAELNLHAVEIIISGLGMYQDSQSEAQLNLIVAADKSSTVQKFIPSEYSYNTNEKYAAIDPGLKWWLGAAERLKNSKLQYTRVYFGAFMDFLGRPNARSHMLSPHIASIDTVKGRALVPGDGTNILGLTYSYDAASFVVKLLDLEEWPEFSCCIGEDTDFITMIKHVEEATNKKLQVTYVDAEDINAGKTDQIEAALSGYNDPTLSIQDLVGFKSMGSQLTLAGALDIPREYRLDEKQVDFKPRSLRQFLSESFQ